MIAEEDRMALARALSRRQAPWGHPPSPEGQTLVPHDEMDALLRIAVAAVQGDRPQASVPAPDPEPLDVADLGLDFAGDAPWEAVRPLVTRVMERARTEMERLRALAEGRFRDAEALRTKSFSMAEGEGTEVSFQGEVVQVVAAGLAAAFKDAGGANYLALELEHEELGPLVLTMQRRWGKEPYKVAGELRAALEDIMIPVEAGSLLDTDADRNFRDSRQAARARELLAEAVPLARRPQEGAPAP